MLALTAPYKTPFDRWSPGLKVSTLFVFTTILLLTHEIFLLLGLASIPFLLIISQGWNYFYFSVRLLRPLWPFVLVIMLWHMYSTNFQSGFRLSLRLVSAFALANFVTTTTTLSQFTDLVLKVSKPFDKKNMFSKQLSMAIGLTVRFLPVFVEQANLLILAHRARSTKKVSWRIIFPLALTALDDAEHVSEALKARGGVSPSNQREKN